MENTDLFIKNMVCNRCIMVVETESKKMGFSPISVSLGKVVLSGKLSGEQKIQVDKELQKFGFELIDDKKTRLVEHIKTAIIELLYFDVEQPKINFSKYISEKLHQEYSSLSQLFSEMKGVTIEKYMITQKIERVKELLDYEELSLSEIAFQLHYSSVSHLSKQFKNSTGLTPTQYKKQKNKQRKPIDFL